MCVHDYNVYDLDFGFLQHQAYFGNTTGLALLHKLIRDGPISFGHLHV